MAGVMPATAQEANMKMLQQIAVSMAAPDADLAALTQLQQNVLAMIRGPIDTPVAASPVGSAMDLSAGASAPPPGQQMPGALSPMLQALMMAGGTQPGMAPPPGPAPAGSFPTHGLMAGPSAPNPDELRRTLSL